MFTLMQSCKTCLKCSQDTCTDPYSVACMLTANGGVFKVSVYESGDAERSAECVLGETMPLIRDLHDLGEMTAIHLSVSQQSLRGGGAATLSKHDWLMSDVECKLIHGSREGQREQVSEADRERLQRGLVAMLMKSGSTNNCLQNILEKPVRESCSDEEVMKGVVMGRDAGKWKGRTTSLWQAVSD